jgi:hypothetical protein
MLRSWIVQAVVDPGRLVGLEGGSLGQVSHRHFSVAATVQQTGERKRGYRPRIS